MIFLERAFPCGQIFDQPIPDNLGKTLLFASILKKYVFFFIFITVTHLIGIIKTFSYYYNYRRMLNKDAGKRIDSKTLFNELSVIVFFSLIK